MPAVPASPGIPCEPRSTRLSSLGLAYRWPTKVWLGGSPPPKMSRFGSRKRPTAAGTWCSIRCRSRVVPVPPSPAVLSTRKSRPMPIVAPSRERIIALALELPAGIPVWRIARSTRGVGVRFARRGRGARLRRAEGSRPGTGLRTGLRSSVFSLRLVRAQSGARGVGGPRAPASGNRCHGRGRARSAPPVPARVRRCRGSARRGRPPPRGTARPSPHRRCWRPFAATLCALAQRRRAPRRSSGPRRGRWSSVRLPHHLDAEHEDEEADRADHPAERGAQV